MKYMSPSQPTRVYWKAAAVAAALLLALLSFSYFAYAAEPGSVGDPLVLKSYVDSKLDALEAKLTTMMGSTQGGAGGGSTGGSGSSGGGGTAAAGDLAGLSAKIDELASSVDRLSRENADLRQSVRRLSPGAGGGEGADGGAGTGSGAGSAGIGADGYSSYSDRFVAVEFAANQRIIFGAGAEFVLRTGKALAIRGELGAIVDLIDGRDLDAGESVPINHLILSPRDDNRGVKVTETAWALIKGDYSLR